MTRQLRLVAPLLLAGLLRESSASVTVNTFLLISKLSNRETWRQPPTKGATEKLQWHDLEQILQDASDDKERSFKSTISALRGNDSDYIIATDLAARAGIGIEQAERDLKLLASASSGQIGMVVSREGDLFYDFSSINDGSEVSSYRVSNGSVVGTLIEYLFGSRENPNEGIEERRMALAAQMIRTNNGIATPEQLAPYASFPLENPDDSQIISQFDGQCRLTKDGDPIYVFPELQISASSPPKWVFGYSQSLSNRKARQKDSLTLKRAGLPPNASLRDVKRVLKSMDVSMMGIHSTRTAIEVLRDSQDLLTQDQRYQLEQEIVMDDMPLLQESFYQFSSMPVSEQIRMQAVGLFSLLCATRLRDIVRQQGTQVAPILGIGSPIVHTCALMFNLIPLLRRAHVTAINKEISLRNEKRRQKVRKLTRRILDIRRTLKSAKAEYSVETRLVDSSEDKILYDSRSPFEKNVERKERHDMQEFDERLAKRSGIVPRIFRSLRDKLRKK